MVFVQLAFVRAWRALGWCFLGFRPFLWCGWVAWSFLAGFRARNSAGHNTYLFGDMANAMEITIRLSCLYRYFLNAIDL